MYVTRHACSRLAQRLGDKAVGVLDTLEGMDGEQGTVAYLLADLPAGVLADDGSNGDILVAVAVGGSVETVYFRRRKQDMSAKFFGARRVVDLRS